MDQLDQARQHAAQLSRSYVSDFMSKVKSTMEEGRSSLLAGGNEMITPVGSTISGTRDLFFKANPPLPPQKQDEPAPIYHPWMIYRSGTGWSVYPASINGTDEPTLDSKKLSATPAPVATTDSGGNLELWFKAVITAESTESGSKYRILAGSERFISLTIQKTMSENVTLSVDEDTGVVNNGIYYYRIGVITGGKKVAQDMHFSLNLRVCGGGSISLQPYG